MENVAGDLGTGYAGVPRLGWVSALGQIHHPSTTTREEKKLKSLGIIIWIMENTIPAENDFFEVMSRMLLVLGMLDRQDLDG